MQSPRYVLGSEGLQEVNSVSSLHTDNSTINNQQIVENNESLGLIDSSSYSLLIGELKIDGIDFDEFLNEESIKNVFIECKGDEEEFSASRDQLKNSEAENGSLSDNDELAVISPDLIYNCIGCEQQLSQPSMVEIKTESINDEDFCSSQPAEITIKREIEDNSPPRSAPKKRKNSEMSYCSSSSTNLDNLPKGIKLAIFNTVLIKSLTKPPKIWISCVP
jgi:hypothetical protein